MQNVINAFNNDFDPAEVSGIFDFEGDLYHKKVDVDIYDRTRDSIKFESTDRLVAQIADDEKKIRDILSTI